METTRAKWTLRKAASLHRGQVQAMLPDAGQVMADQFELRILEPLPRPWCVAGYWPMRSEIDPRPLMARIQEFGGEDVTLALPRTPAKGEQASLSFRLWIPTDQMEKSPFGVDQPKARAPEVIPNVVLVPGLVFSRTGGRLGYGAGHYDMTLAELRQKRPVLAIGIAYADMVRDEVPREAHDQFMDLIATERGVFAVVR